VSGAYFECAEFRNQVFGLRWQKPVFVIRRALLGLLFWLSLCVKAMVSYGVFVGFFFHYIDFIFFTWFLLVGLMVALNLANLYQEMALVFKTLNNKDQVISPQLAIRIGVGLFLRVLCLIGTVRYCNMVDFMSTIYNSSTYVTLSELSNEDLKEVLRQTNADVWSSIPRLMEIFQQRIVEKFCGWGGPVLMMPSNAGKAAVAAVIATAVVVDQALGIKEAVDDSYIASSKKQVDFVTYLHKADLDNQLKTSEAATKLLMDKAERQLTANNMRVADAEADQKVLAIISGDKSIPTNKKMTLEEVFVDVKKTK